MWQSKFWTSGNKKIGRQKLRKKLNIYERLNQTKTQKKTLKDY